MNMKERAAVLRQNFLLFHKMGLNDNRISEKLGVSRERIRQIRSSFGFQTVPRQYLRTCVACKATFTPVRKHQHRCSLHYRLFPKPLLHLTCSQCGVFFTRAAYKDRRRKGGPYCSKYCQGTWLAANYGWGSNAARNLKEA